MILSRRFLRVAALGAVLALGLAGTALAVDTRTWTGGGGDKKWSTPGNWSDSTAPVAGDTAIIGAGAAVEVDGAAANAKLVDLGEGATLTIKTDSLTLDNGGELRASGNAIVTSGVAGGLTFDTTNKVAVSADKTLTLAAEGAGTIVGAAAALELSGAGTLFLKTPVTAATDLKITDGSTLIVEADGDLPALMGTPTITDGNIVINKANFGNTATELTLTKGNLWLNKKMVDGLNKVNIQDGMLVVADGVQIGNGTDGELTLGTNGHLTINTNLTLAKLKTADGSTIKTNDKTLTVAELDADKLNAEVTGNLKLTLADTKTGTLNKNVQGKVEFVAPGGGTATLALAADVKVFSVDFTAARRARFYEI